jgi:rod shape-determining protein MreC
MVLGCGSDTGIKVGQAVISQGYLLAKIVYVGSQTSTAVLITNNQSSVDAKISKNNVEGVVKGSFGSGLVFDLVSQSAEVNENDLVVTAGIDPNIPKNILIGEIGQTISGNNDLFKRMTLVSAVRPNLIDYVFVVKP